MKLIPSKLFLEQLDNLSSSGKNLIKSKLFLIKKNPFRFKQIHNSQYLVFRVRFSDNKKEKRLIYLVKKDEIKLLCILDRDKNYSDLVKYLDNQ